MMVKVTPRWKSPLISENQPNGRHSQCTPNSCIINSKPQTQGQGKPTTPEPKSEPHKLNTENSKCMGKRAGMAKTPKRLEQMNTTEPDITQDPTYINFTHGIH